MPLPSGTILSSVGTAIYLERCEFCGKSFLKIVHIYLLDAKHLVVCPEPFPKGMKSLAGVQLLGASQ